MIGKKEINARIDLKANALVATKDEVRVSTFRAAVNAAESYVRSMRGLLLRSALMRHDLIQRPTGAARGDRQEGPRSAGPHRGERPGGNRRHRTGQRERGPTREREFMGLVHDEIIAQQDITAQQGMGSSGSLDFGAVEALGGQEESGSMLAE